MTVRFLRCLDGPLKGRGAFQPLGPLRVYAAPPEVIDTAHLPASVQRYSYPGYPRRDLLAGVAAVRDQLERAIGSDLELLGYYDLPEEITIDTWKWVPALTEDEVADLNMRIAAALGSGALSTVIRLATESIPRLSPEYYAHILIPLARAALASGDIKGSHDAAEMVRWIEPGLPSLMTLP